MFNIPAFFVLTPNVALTSRIFMRRHQQRNERFLHIINRIHEFGYINYHRTSFKIKMNNPSRYLTSVGRQIDVRLRRHNDVGVRLILKVCLTSKTDVNLTC